MYARCVSDCTYFFFNNSIKMFGEEAYCFLNFTLSIPVQISVLLNQIAN